ncbi:histidine ammonia-lyase [Billgrantia desiderata]|nr:histidine ammonia-lyase [Halomonas desiderata]
MAGGLQGLDFRVDGSGHRLTSTPRLEQARKALRGQVDYYDRDRFFAPDIESATRLLTSRVLNALVPVELLPSH